jgi:Tfp pilus assembly protein PilV
MNNFFKKTKLGSSMIEILIATGVVGLVMTAVVSSLVLSVKNSSVSKYKVIASTRAQEAMEVFRREKVLLGWSQYYDVLSSGTYCINALASDSAQFKTLDVAACNEDQKIAGTSFVREALVNIISDEEIRVEIVVSWMDGNVPRSTNLIQMFKKYEQTL